MKRVGRIFSKIVHNALLCSKKDKGSLQGYRKYSKITDVNKIKKDMCEMLNRGRNETNRKMLSGKSIQ